jgi:hypothetical protein
MIGKQTCKYVSVPVSLSSWRFVENFLLGNTVSKQTKIDFGKNSSC